MEGSNIAMTALIPVEEAIARIIVGVAPMPTEYVALADVAGRTLAEGLKARRSQPPFDASAMDGYAVRARDTVSLPTTLKVIGVSAAGHRFDGPLGPREAVRIFTGAPVPPGADAILIQENAQACEDGTVVAKESVAAGRHIRRAGLDFQENAVLLESGRRLGMREIALAAAAGYSELPVRRRPRVAIIATGDELVQPGTMPAPDQIYASTSVALAAYVRALGGEAHDLGIVRDDRAAIARTTGQALKLPADVVLTIGGASVGDHDFVQDALTDAGLTLDFWRVAMRPGKPVMSGSIEATRVLGLPGNPVSSLVCAILYVRPLIAALLGEPQTDATESATLGSDLPANDSRQDYIRARLATRRGEIPAAMPLPVQDSAMLSVFSSANCLIVRPPHAPAAKAGDECRTIPLP
jgi:molybdopterin molybdotransferase